MRQLLVATCLLVLTLSGCAAWQDSALRSRLPHWPEKKQTEPVNKPEYPVAEAAAKFGVGLIPGALQALAGACGR
jgi:hypothetical protein